MRFSLRPPLLPWKDKRQAFEHSLLMLDPWLAKKLNRNRRLDEHVHYLDRFCPEFWSFAAGTVVDLGPGAGELLEIARVKGHKVLGVDADGGEGGMGAHYLRACRLMVERQQLNVLYVGLQTAMRIHDCLWPAGECCLINSRGSLEQMLCRHMDGEPHHLHHDCRRLRWVASEETIAALRRFVNWSRRLLRSGGVLLIHPNGAANGAWLDEQLQAIGKQVFGAPGALNESGVHKFTKWP